MKTLEVTFNPDEQPGVYAISLVENPAIGVDFVALNQNEEVKFSVMDEEKRLLMGAVLIPEKKILRVDANGEPFWIYFSADTIRQSMEWFYKNSFQSNSTIEHVDAMTLDNVTFVESWIKEDLVHDKSVKFGFSEPVGTWFATMKVDNDDVWAKVKAGQIKGFSIDGVFNFKNVDMNLAEQIKNAIVDGFKSLSMKEEVTPEAVVEEVAEEVPAEVDAQPEAEPTMQEVEESITEALNLSDFAKELALQLGKEIEKVKVELRAEIEALKPKETEVKLTKVTKPNPEVTAEEPKDFKSRMLNKLNNY
jgi:hypothetical protein